jgi:hypothetical protein
MAQTQHQLNLGESIRIKRGLMTQIRLLYAGMPNEHSFSLAVTTTAGHMGMAYNLYLPTHQRQCTIAGIPVTIHGVSATTLQMEID